MPQGLASDRTQVSAVIKAYVIVVRGNGGGGGGSGDGGYYYYYYYYLSPCKVLTRFLGYYSVAAIVCLKFMVHTMVFPILNVL